MPCCEEAETRCIVGGPGAILRSTWDGCPLDPRHHLWRRKLCPAMASPDLKKELECSVCLNVYRDPVTLKCGHNFCRLCIDRVLNGQRKSGIYSCPECREEFQERPALHRNITLRNIVENLQLAQPSQEVAEIFCTHCIHSPVPAVKSCLHCEASLCDNHLKVHSKSPEHVLCDPTTSMEDRKCSVHKELLKYYCTEDSACICVSCSLTGEHWGHQVETLGEASEMKKKTLRNVLQRLMLRREETEKRIQSLQDHRRKVQGKATGEKGRITTLIKDLRRQLKVLEKKVLSEISSQTERVSQILLKMIRQLEVKKEELSRNMGHIKKLCNTMDPLTVLQETDTLDLYDTEDGDDEYKARCDKLLHGGEDLDMTEISHTLHTGLSEIMSGANVLKYTGTHVYPHSTFMKDKVHTNPESPRPAPIVQRSYPQTDPNLEPTRPCLQPAPNVQRSYPQPAPNFEPPRPCPQRAPTMQRSYPQTDPNLEPPRPCPQRAPTIQRSYPQPASTFEPPSQCPQPVSTIQRSYPQPNSIPEPPSPNPQPAPTVQRSYPQPASTLIIKHSYRQARGPNVRAVQQTSGVSGVADILLDVSTAGNRLHISDDRKTASWLDYSQNFPETPERFQVYPQVLSSQSFSSGSHYWEVDVGGSGDWIVGVCYPSIDREGGQSLIGGSEKSWGLERWGWDKQYLVIHDREKIQLPDDVSINRVRIDLDYEAGRISFYDLCDPIQLLHTFTTTFTEPLHAGFYIGDGCITISGGSAM
ncbi:E3 ubiquitin/ISG15 ligase TRIM25-like [Mantella aurantiaca]